MKNKVYIIQNEDLIYPKTECFHPSEKYPEYPFKELSNQINTVYSSFRKLMYNMGLDYENYGSNLWNPLGKWIKPGQNVVIKPNWVNDSNFSKKTEKNELDCLVTHPSVVRVICDYVLIALKGKGRVVICDSPIQECDLYKLWSDSNLESVRKFYLTKSLNVSFKDLRSYRTLTNRFAVKIDEDAKEGISTIVTMNDKTAFRDISQPVNYSVPCYPVNETTSYHLNGNHKYSLSKSILDADVVINCPKPKTHRYAGITASLKNVVGMVCEKVTLPHRMIGSKKNGGDSYAKPNIIKKSVDNVLSLQASLEKNKHYVLATICRFFYGGFYCLDRVFNKDHSLKGCWHGNDTIWRTILDLNYILRYSNKKGVLEDNEQRTVINIADMVVSGERNGPLSPEPVPLNMLMFSESAESMDMTIASIMHFNVNNIPLLKNIKDNNTWISYLEPTISINKESDKLLSDVEFNNPQFEPHIAWKGIIET